MKKALIIATVGRFYDFLRSDIRILQSHGYEVHCATNLQMSELDRMKDFEGIVKHQIDFARSPFSKTNMNAYRQLCSLMKKSRFEIIHCHTPMGAVLGRLAAQKYRKKGTRLFYTAHGLHFYEGAPLKNWLIYFPIEWMSSFWTDTMIMINQEDYARAKSSFHAKQIYYIPSIGIDIAKYEQLLIDRDAKRAELGITKGQVMIVSVGELSARKNQELVIRALGQMRIQNVKYILVGEGDKKEQLLAAAKEAQIEEQIVFLGHRDDVGEILKAADLFLIPSLQEGVSMALLEAVACQTPVICSDIRGTVDVIEDQELLFNPHDRDSLIRALQQLCTRSREGSVCMDATQIREKMRLYIEKNSRNLRKFDITKVAQQMERIYFEISNTHNLNKTQNKNGTMILHKKYE